MTAYWFRPKQYGYGATPVTWQGWVLTLLLPAAVAASIPLMQFFAGRTNFVAWMVWAACVVVAVAWFVQLTRRKTDGEWRWRWGDRA